MGKLFALPTWLIYTPPRPFCNLNLIIPAVDMWIPAAVVGQAVWGDEMVPTKGVLTGYPTKSPYQDAA